MTATSTHGRVRSRLKQDGIGYALNPNTVKRSGKLWGQGTGIQYDRRTQSHDGEYKLRRGESIPLSPQLEDDRTYDDQCRKQPLAPPNCDTVSE